MAQINGRQCKSSLKIALQMCVCESLSACVRPLMEAMMCVVIFVPLFICPGHNKPITRADGEGWVMRAPSPSGDETARDRWRLSADAGRAALAPAARPPQHLRPRRRCHAAAGAAAAAAALVVSGLKAAVCFMMNQICRKPDSFGRA